jgi:protein-S-isoprenylcysteine O-methyltransferase Ste14
MNQPVAIIVCILWVAFFMYWWIPVLWTRTRVRKVASRGSFLSLTVLPVVAVVIPLCLFAPWLYGSRLLPDTLPVVLAGLLVNVLGIGFAIWARWHLGTNWSARPAIKENHTITRTGPYVFVRHPIYTGILIGILGTAIATGSFVAFISIFLVLGVFLAKIRIEETFLLEEFGEEYARYRREVKALVPWVV